jgi:uncharacterized repeat protein (TIGR03803 family)
MLIVGATLLPTSTRAATTVLHNFNFSVKDGIEPYGSPTLSGAKLYGMTQYGGSSDRGVVFSVNTDGSGYDLLHSFTGGASDGAHPYDSLTLSGTKLYGMTEFGGNGDFGTIFSVNTDGTGFSLLHSFSEMANDGRNPQGSLTLSGSKLYGMARDVIFSVNTDGTGFGLLHIYRQFHRWWFS